MPEIPDFYNPHEIDISTENVTIGARPEDCLGEDWGISVVGHKKTIPSGTVIKPKEIV